MLWCIVRMIITVCCPRDFLSLFSVVVTLPYIQNPLYLIYTDETVKQIDDFKYWCLRATCVEHLRCI